MNLETSNFGDRITTTAMLNVVARFKLATYKDLGKKSIRTTASVESAGQFIPGYDFMMLVKATPMKRISSHSVQLQHNEMMKFFNEYMAMALLHYKEQKKAA